MTGQETSSGGPRAMRLRYAGRCRKCASQLARGTRPIYDPRTKTVSRLDCESGDVIPVAEPTEVMQPAKVVEPPK